MNIPDILPYFDHWKRSGNGQFMASCPMPNHDDADPSVSVTQDVETGKIIMKCWGCNSKAPELVAALGLHLSDLFGDPGHPAAVKQSTMVSEVSSEDRANLEQRVKAAIDRLDEAKDYILSRFNLSVEQGRALSLGVDSDFGVPHLIIPFKDPNEQIVGMQGRRLVDGEPRWRSLSGGGWSKLGCFGWDREGPVVVCYSDDTEVLTDNGWCLLSTLDSNAVVAQYEQDNGTVSFTSPLDRQIFPYTGEMVEWDSRWNTLSVTPDHRILHRNHITKAQLVTAANKVGPRRDFPVAGVKVDGTKPEVNVRLATAFQADGSLLRDGKYPRWEFAKPRKVERLISILEESGIPYRVTLTKRGTTVIFIPQSAAVDLWLPKTWDWDMLKWDLTSREEFLTELRYWDGSDTDPNTDTYEYTTAIAQNAEVVCAIAAISGRGSTSTSRIREGNRVPQHRVIITNKTWRQSANRSVRRNYDGDVYCLTVPSGFLVTRRNGNVVISGNCEGPSDAIAVVGQANLPTIAIRGAANTSEPVCTQIKEWLNGKTALVIGDNGEAGEKFARGISEGVGIPSWTLPAEYDDLCDYLSAGGSLADAVQVAFPSEVDPPRQSNQEQATDLIRRITCDLPNAVFDEELKEELRTVPQGYLEAIFARVIETAGYGQRTITRNYLTALQRSLQDRPPGAGGGNDGGGNQGHIPHPNPNNLPVILWNAEDQLMITESHIRDAMDQYDGDGYYRAALGQYVTVSSEDLIVLKEPGVKSMLSHMGHWRIMHGQRELGHVPSEAAKIVTEPSWECDIRTIKRRVEVPFMLADGSIISTTGFHEESGIYLLPRSSDRIVVPEVPTVVTDEDVRKARTIFEDVVQGFMFTDQCSKTNLIAMTLTSPLRELFSYNPMVPILTSTAPQSGSGKGTSVRVPLSTCGIGPFSLATTAYNPDENEFEKKLVGKLLKKSTYIFLDNIRSQVNSSVLEQMLTAANYDGRTLGYSEVNCLSTLLLWVCTLQSTGSFNRDLTRRCVPVQLLKNYKGAWDHNNIEAYLAAMRGEMIWACFVSARKWLQDGANISRVRLDGYGGWTEVIGGILENVLGYEGFLGNLDTFRKSQDEIALTIDGILETWLGQYGEEEYPARMAIVEYEDPALHNLLGLRNPSTRQVITAMIRQLDSQRGHIIRNSHMWTPVGLKSYRHEGLQKLYRCVPLPKE